MSCINQIKNIENLELIIEIEKGIKDIENNNICPANSVFEEIEKSLMKS